jgi:hypothetical protein
MESGGWTGSTRVSGDREEPFVLEVRPAKRPSGTVRGRLRFADGSWEPVFVGVSAWTPDGDHPVGQPGWADVDGSFAVTGLPAGTWDLRVWTSDAVRGSLAGVAVPEGGTVEAVVPCERVPEAERRRPARPAELLARAVLPGGGAGEGPVRAFATGSRGTRSAEGRAGEDGVFRMKVSDSDTFTVWAWSREAGRAGVAREVPPGAEGPVEVPLAAAGWIVVPGDPEGSVRWLVLKDGEGTVLWSGPESALPGVPGEGVHLVVPPGAYEVVLARGIARRDPRSLRARVLAGAGSAAE